MDHSLKRSEVVTTGMVAAELLAGSSQSQIEELRRTLLGLDWFDLLPEDWFRVGTVSNDLRTSGTPIHASDIQIAVAAASGGVPLLTLDRGFLTIKQVLPELDLSVSAGSLGE